MASEEKGQALSAHLDRECLMTELQKALRQTLFSSHLSVSPRRVGEIGREVADDFFDFLEMKDEEGARAYGRDLAMEGLGHRSILTMSEALRRVCRESGNPTPLPVVAGDYVNALLEGYMGGREDSLLEEQARTRRALKRAQERRGR